MAVATAWHQAVARCDESGDDQIHADEHPVAHRHAGKLEVIEPAHPEHGNVQQDSDRDGSAAGPEGEGACRTRKEGRFTRHAGFFLLEEPDRELGSAGVSRMNGQRCVAQGAAGREYSPPFGGGGVSGCASSWGGRGAVRVSPRCETGAERRALLCGGAFAWVFSVSRGPLRRVAGIQLPPASVRGTVPAQGPAPAVRSPLAESFRRDGPLLRTFSGSPCSVLP